jgi:hypothetical protein
MDKFNGTKGKCKIGNCGSVVSESSEGLTIGGEFGKDAVDYYGGNLICESVSNSNAELIVDAFNTVTECDLMPSELLKQRDELLESLQEIIKISDRNHIAWNKAKSVIKKVTE